MATMLDAEDRVVGPEKEAGDPRSRITWGFNAGLFGFQAAIGFLLFVLTSGRAGGVSLPGLIFSTSLDAIRYGSIVLLAACFVGAFWRKFAIPVFGVRDIAYREAVAVILILGLIATR